MRLLMARSKAGEFGLDDFNRHLPVFPPVGQIWRIGDPRHSLVYHLGRRQAIAVAVGDYSLSNVPAENRLPAQPIPAFDHPLVAVRKPPASAEGRGYQGGVKGRR